MTPLALCRRNPHYLQYKDQPVVLIGSGEHYGAVLNRPFDYVRYLDTLAADGLNLTRTFAGTYREAPGSFGIVDNVLAPQPDQFICPFKRIDPDGGYRGGGVYDLTQWDDTYFERLTDFMAEAQRRDVIVELVLFCFWYNDELWQYSPMHANNAAAGGGTGPRHDVYAPPTQNPMIGLHEAVTTKIVTELNAFDNLYYEIMNEPYSCHNHTAFIPWQHHIIDVIARTEASLPRRHLIARNVQNRCMRVADPHPEVSIFNFHYAEPEAVGDNYHLGKVIGDDETGFKGQAASPYRYEAWNFMLSGGGVFSHLDYSFTTGCPDGTAPILGETPGYGGVEWRCQLGVLKSFIESFDFAAMIPHNECVNVFTGALSRATTVRVLSDPPNAYAAYVCGGGPDVTLGLGIAAGNYRAEWIHPATGATVREDTCEHPGGSLRLASPRYCEDLALRLTRV